MCGLFVRAGDETMGAMTPDQEAGEDPACDYPRTNSGPLCHAEESGYLDSTDVFCPFQAGPGYACTSGCPTNRERACILGED
jgi:hypothetical protein